MTSPTVDQRDAPPRAKRLLRALAVIGLLVAGLVASLFRPDESVASLRETYGRKPSRYVALDGMEVHYRDEGPRDADAPPLLLLHGTSSSLHTWDGWVVRMQDTRRVVRLDLPGFGLTGPRPDHDYRTTTYVALVVRLLDALHVEQVDVAGNSFGGRIAWTLAALHPERVRKLVLVDPSGFPDMPRPKIFQLATSPLSGLLRWCTPDFMVRRNVEQVYGDPSLVEDALVERHARLLRREGNREALIDRLRTDDAAGLVERLRDVRAPTLIMWGERDAWIPVSYATEFRDAIPGSRIALYKEAGHVPMEEMAEETARDAAAFLDAR